MPIKFFLVPSLAALDRIIQFLSSCKIRIIDLVISSLSANPQTIVDICHSLYRNNWNAIFFVDGDNRGAVNLMKVAFDESLNRETNDVSPEIMKVLPINFTIAQGNVIVFTRHGKQELSCDTIKI